MTDFADMPSFEPSPAPEIYVDAFHGVATANGVLKINFVSVIADPQTGEAQKRVVLRMTATAGNLMAITDALGAAVRDLARMNVEASGDGVS